MTNVNYSREKKQQPKSCTKQWPKIKYDTKQTTSTTELQVLDLRYANTECGCVKHVSERQTPP